ncbi:MAG TPA: hypothetical protein VNJ53_01200 [Gaiellaceae bacterium]|nr:hypothetical protein [Gaiellaceae bacterium]
MSDRLLASLAELLGGDREPDDALRGAVRLLATEPGISWAGIAFLEEGALRLGPEAGEHAGGELTALPVRFQGDLVGELRVEGGADTALLARVVELLAGHVLVGWDTGGEAWEP